ncbi:helix-turn-helix domain-containing protein [Paractinoplanes rishiriensis]|uniref:HTH luxR-type domain-containing protein n=1 Tax=Paractinoplanes rishiriensis TaxID=1050105 RepID=A0A919MZ16_9ACTN|nr:helix-turn-helix domain-containing protein [Actinoplanes rishiriensis]GIF00645.1 hypothetical protein Ari01nite_81090 [Actinoplanes rishiriensis]
MPDVALPTRERTLIALLAAGFSDASAARKLKISRRSVTYSLRNLMDRLGVDNRFQLGLALGALGVAKPYREVPARASSNDCFGGSAHARK